MNKLRLSLSIVPKLLLVLLLISGLALNIILPVHAATEIRVLNPATGNTNFQFYTNVTSVGARFNATVYVYDVNDLYSFQVLLKYNSTIINATRAWVPWDNSSYVFYGKSTIRIPAYFYYNDLVYGTSVLVGDTLIGLDTFSGSGLLAIVEFEIVSEPATGETLSGILNIDDAENTFLIDSQGGDISTLMTNGLYQFTWVAVVEPYFEIKPSSYEAAQLETFNITVWLNNIESNHKLVDITFSLSYDATLLNLTQVTEDTFLSQVGPTTFDYTDEVGNLTVHNYLTPPYTSFPSGNGEIAILTFQGIYQDAEEHSSELRVHKIQLLDDSATPIPISPAFTKHGSYRILSATSTITINVPSQMIVGTSATINGTITPTKTSVEVTVYYRITGTTEWNVLSNVTTNSNSHYTYTWTPTQTGYFQFYASWPGDNLTLGDGSETKLIQVKTKDPSGVTLNFAPSTVVVFGGNITITGVISPSRALVNVTIYYKLSNETIWSILAVVKTDAQSQYSYTWVTPELGQYNVRAGWAGDLNTLAANSTAKIVDIVESLGFDFMAYLPYVAGGIIIVLIVVVLYFKRFRK